MATLEQYTAQDAAAAQELVERGAWGRPIFRGSSEWRRRPKALDAFAGQGGATVGLIRAGFDVTSVELEAKHEKRFPLPARFVAADAIQYIWDHGHEYDYIHASPPCQPFTIALEGNPEARANYQDLVAETRDALDSTGRPYTIENVVRAPLIRPLILCWQMFYRPGSVIDDDGTPLRMERHRAFESNFLRQEDAPTHFPHDKAMQVAGSYGGARRDKVEAREIRKGGYVPSFPVQQRLMDLHHTTQRALYESIPPAYTQWTGLMAQAYLMTEVWR